MNTGGFAQMSHNGFAAPTGMGMSAGGLASRRGGGQNIKPLSFDVTKTIDPKDNGIPTPRTSRSHLLAGLRTAPKSATVASFGLASPTTSGPSQSQVFNRVNGMQPVQEHMNGPKTSLPRMATQNQSQHQQFLQQQQQQHQQQRAVMMQQQQQRDNHQHFTTEQILAPPEIMLDEQEQMDPNLYNQLVATNMYLAQQQQRLQQQLLSVQAAAQQFQGMNLNSQASFQQQIALQNLYQQQQQQLSNLQQSMAQVMPAQQNLYSYYDPVTGQQGYYVDQGPAAQVQAAASYMDQTPATPHGYGQQMQRNGPPRVQVSPPMESQRGSFRTNSPPKKLELSGEHEPLPPPSANAFRRGHKKAPSLAKLTLNNTAVIEEAPASAGLKPAVLASSAVPSGYGPGQARAGEHPVRQPRGPPALDELKAKPTTYFEGSKNFSTRTRRSALKNLVKAGLERRKGGSSCGSMSPVSESAEELATPMTDDESDSGQSGSGSLSGDAEPSLASSRTSTSGSWGAIGSERPGSRQKTRKSHESLSSACESDGSFASVFKNGAQRGGKEELADGQRKTRLVLTSADKRKSSNPVA